MGNECRPCPVAGERDTMSRIGITLALALAILAGCEAKRDGSTSAEQESARVAQRDASLASHHAACVDVFIKTEMNGAFRMMVERHKSNGFPRSLDLPAIPDIDEAGNPVPAAG